MKQPELGRKITELRKTRSLTQEELVDKCNISVRTIQRIEAGEVTPRSYTVKTIMAALEYDMNLVSGNGENTVEDFMGWIKRAFLLDVDENKPADFLTKQLNLAWIFGVLYFILGFFDSAAEFYRAEEGRMIFGIGFYIVIKVLSLVALIFFQRGFIVVGGLYKNYLLKIMSVLWIFGLSALVMYDIASVFYDAVERRFILGAVSLTFGGMGIVWGLALMRLQKFYGVVAQGAGIFEIIAGCFFVTIVLFFIGFIVLIPAELLEIILLYKTVEIIRQKQSENN